MPSAKAASLDPLVAEMAKAFELKDGKVSMPPASAKKWRLKVATFSVAEDVRFAEHCMVLAMRFNRKAGEPAAVAVAQLYHFAGLALQSAAKAKAKSKTK